MQRLILAVLVACTVQVSALAQETETCLSDAQAARNECTRAADDDDVASRKCMDGYLNATSRCQGAAAVAPEPESVPPERMEPAQPAQPEPTR